MSEHGEEINETNLGEGGGTGRHEDVTDAVVERSHCFFVHTQEGHSSALLGVFVLQVPCAGGKREGFGESTNLRRIVKLKLVKTL